jgi:acetate kinase
MLAKLPGVPNVAVFDTSFHATIPEKAYTYPLPLEYRELQMRKFGFHGTSAHYVSQIATDIIRQHKMKQTAPLSSPSDHPPQYEQNIKPINMVVCHLGSGASVTAVVGGESKDTSMGFTPLAGLMMETRCGSVDPSLVGFACHALNKSVDQVTSDFNTKSGLKGMVGADQDFDMRALLSRNDAQACLAVDMFVYRLAQNIASTMVGLDGPLDALVFTAGIGEHSEEIRRLTIRALGPVLPNVQLDEERNAVHGKDSRGILSVDWTLPLLLVIPTNEEAMIAQECQRVIAKSNI